MLQNKTPWIISHRQDLLWFQGTVLVGLALLVVFKLTPGLDGANYTAGHPAVVVLLLWGVVFDGTHVWATYARTFFAPDAESRAGLPGTWAWGVILIGPAAAVLDAWLFASHPSVIGQAGALFASFLAFAYLWAYYHLVRQHYGFMMLYRRKEAASPPHLDVLVLWIGSGYAFVRFTLGDAYVRSGLPAVLPPSWLAGARVALDLAFAAVMAGLAIYYLVDRARTPATDGRHRLGPKHLFLLIVVVFQIVVFRTLTSLLTITATLTIFHNLQYHRIVWQYERGHGRLPMRTLARFLAFGLVFGVLWYGPRTMGPALAPNDLARNMLVGLGWGIAFHHYVVDARIWRVRRSPALAQALDAGAKAA
jgi:hypothetical protein